MDQPTMLPLTLTLEETGEQHHAMYAVTTDDNGPVVSVSYNGRIVARPVDPDDEILPEHHRAELAAELKAFEIFGEMIRADDPMD